MLYAFRLGPIEIAEGRFFVYAALGEGGPVEPSIARTDAEGLRAIAEVGRDEELRCEAVLAKAGAKLGFRAAPLPPEVLVPRAVLAFLFAAGPLPREIGPALVSRYLSAFASFWRASPWERFNGDEPVLVRIIAGDRVFAREASVLGQGGEVFGLALYEERGAVARVHRLLEEGRAAESRRVPAVAATIDDEPAFAAEAVENAYEVPGVPLPVKVTRSKVTLPSADELVTVTAALEAFATIMPHGAEARSSVEIGGHRVEAVLALPDLREVAHETGVAASAASSPPRVPRNAPCHCGSGKKYKKCHLPQDEAQARGAFPDETQRLAERDPVHALDGRLVEEILALARRRWGAAFDPEGFFSEEIGADPEMGQLFLPWAAFHYDDVEGRSAAEVFLGERRARLSVEERAWLEAQCAARLSIWEVLSTVPGTSVTLRDLLCGEERTVCEVSGSRCLAVRDVVLARVVDHGGRSFLGGSHARPLPPREGAAAAEQLRSDLRCRAKKVPDARLRESAGEGTTIAVWQAIVDELDERPPPQLANTDGDPLLMTTDRFAMAVGALEEVRARLLGIPGVVQEEDDQGGAVQLVFSKPGNARFAGMETTLLARATLEASTLRIETNSVERADALRKLVDDEETLALSRGPPHHAAFYRTEGRAALT